MHNNDRRDVNPNSCSDPGVIVHPIRPGDCRSIPIALGLTACQAATTRLRDNLWLSSDSKPLAVCRCVRTAPQVFVTNADHALVGYFHPIFLTNSDTPQLMVNPTANGSAWILARFVDPFVVGCPVNSTRE